MRRRTTLDPFRRFVAVIGVGLVLTLTVLAVCPTLHAWLHGEKHLDPDDDCVVVLFAHGVTPPVAALVLLTVYLRVRRERPPIPAVFHLAAPDFDLPPICGPPVRLV